MCKLYKFGCTSFKIQSFKFQVIHEPGEFTHYEFQDTRELEELTSSGSVSASDYEVIDGGDTVDESEAK